MTINYQTDQIGRRCFRLNLAGSRYVVATETGTDNWMWVLRSSNGQAIAQHSGINRARDVLRSLRSVARAFGGSLASVASEPTRWRP